MKFFVDLPTLGKEWQHVAVKKTKQEAVAWIRQNVCHCDENGNVCLITEEDTEEEEKP